MTTPLIEALVVRHGIPVVDEASLDGFLKANEHAVLFFPGDAERLVESNDVAVILPELCKAFGKRLAPALIAKASERQLQRRFRFNAFPSLVFMRRDGYLGVLSRVLDWSDYMIEIQAILASEPTEPPPFKFPDGCYAAGMPREGNQPVRGEL
ncbi:hydrogenase-1 expression HyaE [Hyphomicrobium denitrificans 1NES1]|uniref:Hydrogenase-1 expression HyaE n=1 Tax=Hyphomicrobium denitrificans 1NES1 TaxID=670307 RepID=N0B9W5_9HYPH|nr:hydrogenase-1 expression HyaE [Hyphomicrobium denitrificans]AGK57341.1 hydrogenase-1 expression HyaE [Hyphomicrobium denitrificans 1NES1]